MPCALVRKNKHRKLRIADNVLWGKHSAIQLIMRFGQPPHVIHCAWRLSETDCWMLQRSQEIENCLLVCNGNRVAFRRPAAWSTDSQFLYLLDVLEEYEPVRRARIKDRTFETVAECRPLLEGGVQCCGFEDVMPDGSVVLQLTRGDHDVYALDVELP